MKTGKSAWWKEGIIYEVYVKSFYDSNVDGIGDFKGLQMKLPYLKEIGVSIIWLTPIFHSPDVDHGYDVSNYRDTNPNFGSLDAFLSVVDEAHRLRMRVVLDMVLNHTSDQHPWFTESRSSRDNAKRDWYIWKRPVNGKPPNNWKACFGGPAWSFDENTGEYYLHLFTPGQPDLNWKNPYVKKEIFSILKYWLEHGIDGFRFDVINLLLKDNFIDIDENNTDFFQQEAPYINADGMHTLLREMNDKVFSLFDCFTFGEVPGTNNLQALSYTDNSDKLDSVIHYDHAWLDINKSLWIKRDFDFIEYKRIISLWYETIQLGGWVCQYLSSHDLPRTVSHYGNDEEYHELSSKSLIGHLLTLPGTPIVYQGEEIGMRNSRFTSIDDYRDVETINYYRNEVASGKTVESILEKLWKISRDNARTPMHWSSEDNGGFTSGIPWIPCNSDFSFINVDDQQNDPNSILSFFKCMNKFRTHNYNLLVYGDFELLYKEHPSLFCYLRKNNDLCWYVIMNVSSMPIPNNQYLEVYNAVKNCDHVVSNYSSKPLTSTELLPWEFSIYQSTRI